MEINVAPRSGLHFQNPVSSFLLVLFLSFLVFTFIGPFLGILFVLPFFDYDVFKIVEQLGPPYINDGIRIHIYVIQGVASVLGFILFPILYLKYTQKFSVTKFFSKERVTPLILVLVGLLVLSFMVVNSLFIEWNRSLPLPQFFIDLEDQAAELTTFLTSFSGLTELVVALIVISIIPAFGEELVFRGILQKMAFQFTGNSHIAIWICAFIFSAFHMQFLGFVPRLLLGGLFGYLYVWSGTLWIPVFAHFVNNAFTIVMVYLYHSDQIKFDIEETTSVPIGSVLLFSLLCVALLYFIRKFNQKEVDERVAEGI